MIRFWPKRERLTFFLIYSLLAGTVITLPVSFTSEASRAITSSDTTINPRLKSEILSSAAAKKKSKKKTNKESKKERKARLNPQISPPPKWPPKGFTESNGIYAKIPSKRELGSIVSARSGLFEAIKPCTDVACGSVIVASAEKCLWWEVLSTVVGPKISDSATITSYGSLTTKISGSDARKEKVILLISSEPIAERVRVSNINVTCHRSGKKGKSGNTYLPFEERG